MNAKFCKVLAIICIMVMCFGTLQAQQKIIGQVKDSNSPIRGATIELLGSNIKAQTDENGRFSILASYNDKLKISSIGYVTQEVKVTGETLDITLILDNQAIEEIIVAGYTSQKKATTTGAISTISAKEINGRPITRLSEALQGLAGNLNITTTSGGGAPNATQNINIRGYTGFGTSGGPLIVIDGIQGGNINNINPSDIESITVVKDAATAAIYGSSAPNGVLLITTKQGSKGGKPTITYSNNLQLSNPINLPQMANSLDFALLFNKAALNGGSGAIFSDATIQRIKDYQAGTFKDETIQESSGGVLTDNWSSWSGSNANNDWFKIYFKNLVFNQQHNLGVSGGSDNSTYYIGLGLNDKNGAYNFGKDEYKRYNVRTNLSSDITNWLNFSLRANATRELYNTPNTYSGKTGGNYLHVIGRKWPTVPLYNPDGRFNSENDIILHQEGGRNNELTDDINFTGEINLKLAQGWTATANYTFNAKYQNNSTHLKTVYSYRPSGAQQILAGNPNAFNRMNARTENQVVNAFSQYQKTLGDHYFSVLGGFVSEIKSYETFNALGNQLYSDNIPSLSLSYGIPANSDFIRRLATNGFFSKVNYNFQEKYLVEFNGRYDATSRFLANSRWKFYPGVALGWNIDKESFFETLQPIVNAFKLRGSYGSLGDQGFLDPDPNNPNYYPFYPNLGTNRATNNSWLFDGAQQASVSPPGLVNPNLTWVTTKQLNLGTDIRFFDNRLETTFDWYIRKADDFATAGAEVPSVLGTVVPLVNNSGLKTTGFELAVTWRDQIGEVGYGAKVILSDYRSEITSFPNNVANSFNNYYVGKQQGEIWGYETVGLFQSEAEVSSSPDQSKINGSAWTPGDVRYADLNGDGKIDWGNSTLDNPGDMRIIGNNTPRYSYSFNGNINYKGFDLSIFLQGIGKRDAWVGSNYFWGIVGDEWQSIVYKEHLNRYSEENPNGYFPKPYLTSQNGKNTQTQTRYLQNAAYLRIKNLQVGYTVPNDWLEKIRIGALRVYFSVDNLATFTKLIKTMDPELSINEAKIYPLNRVYSFGLNISL